MSDPIPKYVDSGYEMEVGDLIYFPTTTDTWWANTFWLVLKIDFDHSPDGHYDYTCLTFRPGCKVSVRVFQRTFFGKNCCYFSPLPES